MTKNSTLKFVMATVGLVGAATCGSAQSHIESVTRVTSSPACYERVDFTVIATAQWQDDPYCSAQVKMDFDIVAPDGTKLLLPAYYDEGPSGKSSVWRARFAPSQYGQYSGVFVLTDASGTARSEPVSFDVAPSDSKGFLHADSPWVLRFDDGEPFRGVGENMCWEAVDNDSSGFFKELNENKRFNFDYLIGKLARCGGNFTRVWMCSWGIPLEWKKISPDLSRYQSDPAHFNHSAIAVMDHLVDLLGDADVYLMLAIGSHTDLRDNWEQSNYNKANGGPVATPAEFFTDAAAKAMYKDRLRYIVARWGYSTHIAMWEFFNEIDNVVYADWDHPLPHHIVTEWHAEMAAYLKSIDPYGHIVTTSIAVHDLDGLDSVPDIDINQKHYYRQTSKIPAEIESHLKEFGKPFVVGEFGYDWDWKHDFSKFYDGMDYDYKYGLWLGMFSPTPVLPMSWWWELFDERGLVGYLARVRAMSDRMVADGGGHFEQANVSWTGDDVTAMALCAGDVLYVFLGNSGREAASGNVVLPDDDAASRSMRIYDTEADSWSEAEDVGFASDASIQVSVPARDSVILMLRPEN